MARNTYGAGIPHIPEGQEDVVVGADTLLGTQVEVEADLVVLATAVTAAPVLRSWRRSSISLTILWIYVESHPNYGPLKQTRRAYFLPAQPRAKDIPHRWDKAARPPVKSRPYSQGHARIGPRYCQGK